MPNRLHRSLFLGFIGLYFLISIMPLADPSVLQFYDITQERARLLSFAIAVPSILIWLGALYGIDKFQEYAMTIKDTKEGPSFNLLSRGLRVLVMGLPVMAFLSSFINYVRFRNPDILPAITIIRNYVGLIFAFLAFFLISKGAESLLKTLKNKDTLNAPKPGLFGTITLSCLYTWLLVVRPSGIDSNNAYYLPNLILILTLAVPYLYIWCKGLTAAFRIYFYKSRVRGRIYKEGLTSISLGLTSVIFLSISMQIIMTLSARLRTLKLSPLFILIYAILALTLLGYGLIARGSQKLKHIEEV